MEKTLNKIQKFAKAGSIFSKIVLWCSIIGGVACLILLVAQLVVGNSRIMTDSLMVKEYFTDATDFNLETLLAGTVIGLIMCVSEIINSKMAINYFDAELKQGNPFTTKLADQLKKLGLATIIINIVSIVLANVTYEVFAHYYTITNKLNVNNGEEIWLGLGFILVSLICRYVAEEKEII